MDDQICKPDDTYVIVEQIHSKPFPISLQGIGPELVQVVRRILQICDIQDVFSDGQRLSSTPNGWQLFQDLIGWKKLSTQPTGKSQFILAYAGFKNVVTPLPKIGNLLPEKWTSAHLTPTPSLYFFGQDPIPHIQLYGNSMAWFIMPSGQPPATAIAIYHGATGNIDYINSIQQEGVESVLRNLSER